LGIPGKKFKQGILETIHFPASDSFFGMPHSFLQFVKVPSNTLRI
jgi:hypothetical protein